MTRRKDKGSKVMKEVKYDIIKEIGIISEKRTISFEFNIISWSGDDPKYDIRRWNKNGPLKGITLSTEEAEILLELLKQELE